jgi:hypothetical protein
MMQTFTPGPDLAANETEKEEKSTLLEFAEPSENTLQNILNYSKNLEIKQSKWISSVELLKS